MKPSKIGKPSRAIIVAVLALVAALAGTAVAGPNADTAVTAKKAFKTAKKAFKKTKQNKNAIANIGLTPGPQGDPGATNVTVRFGPGSASVGQGNQTSDTASCNPGEVATGGGYFLNGDATHSRVYNNLAQGITQVPTQWHVAVYNDAGMHATSVSVTAQVNCSAP